MVISPQTCPALSLPLFEGQAVLPLYNQSFRRGRQRSSLALGYMCHLGSVRHHPWR